jgi:hypothetical protein
LGKKERKIYHSFQFWEKGEEKKKIKGISFFQSILIEKGKEKISAHILGIS